MDSGTSKTPVEPIVVDIVAPSGSVVPWELDRGLNLLRDQGFHPRLAEGVHERHFVFAGEDLTRARGVWNAACAPDSRIVWAARGGYGAARILPELHRLTRLHGPPPRKLLCGYSDITALHAFVRREWGWSTLHCDMPASARFGLSHGDLTATLHLLRGTPGEDARPAWAGSPLEVYGRPPARPVEGVLVGGNLTVLTSLVGTPFALPADRGRILFLEDVSEAPYRIDRYLNQLVQSGFFHGIDAVVLGTFDDCIDAPSQTTRPDGTVELSRPRLPYETWHRHVFTDLAQRLAVPVFHTLPVGHGPERAPLPLHAAVRLTPGRPLELLSWDWPG